MKITLIRCHAIWKRKTDVIDTESLFENDGAQFRLYFQPTLYLLEELWDKEGFQAAVVWACYRPHPAPPAGVEMPLHLIICQGLTVQETVYRRGWKEFLWHTSSWKLSSLRITEMFLVWACDMNWTSFAFFVCPQWGSEGIAKDKTQLQFLHDSNKMPIELEEKKTH